MPTLHIQLLGDFQLTLDAAPLKAVNQPRMQSLLAYLLLHRQAPQSRQHLAFTFWPELTESAARNNLRQLLHQLRHALPDNDLLLAVDGSTVHWLAEGPFRLDVAQFEQAAAHALAAEAGPDRRLDGRALAEAAGLYTGDLLPSCYDDWIAPERDRLRRQYQALLVRLVQQLEALRDYPAALDAAHRLLRLDPANEDTYLSLMRLHALNQDRTAALRVYHECVTALRQELDVEPGAAVHAAYEQLLRAHSPSAPAPAHPSLLTGSAHLVGRHAEWKQLRAAWQAARGGRASAVLIAGEAGIGKSRLAEELFNSAAQQGFATARARAYAAEGALAYSSIADWLRSPSLAASLGRLDPVWLSEIARLLPELLSRFPALTPPGPLTEFWQRQRFFEALARGVLAGQAPLLLLMDDLQWCDPETLEWLHFLSRFNPAAPLLVIGTLRAEELAGNTPLLAWLRALRAAGQLSEISLAPFDAADTSRLAASLLGRELDSDQAAQLFDQTEGNPLFTLETLRAQFAGEPAERALPAPRAGAAAAPTVLPPRVYAVIAGRLALLSPPARELAGVAATIGRAFTVDILALACDQPEDGLVNALDELWQRRLIREQGGQAYDFSHDKLREVAYAELSPMQRRRLHQRVALALESVYAAEPDPVSAQMAAHYEQAGLPNQAIRCYRRAAHVAQRLFANLEAIGLFRRGLALLPHVPPGRPRDELELSLRTPLGVSLVETKGYAAAEVIEVFTRARELGAQLGQPPIPSVLRALAVAHNVRAEFQLAFELGEQLLHLSALRHDPVLEVEAHYVLGVSSFWQGDFVASRRHLEKALAGYDAQQSATHIALFSQDPKVVCLSRLALTLWCLGDSEQALQVSQSALALARELAHPFSHVYAAYIDAHIHNLRRAAQATKLRAEELIGLSRQHRLSHFMPLGQGLHGWALVEQGLFEAGVTEQREAMAGAQAGGNGYLIPYFSALLAEQYGRAGEVDRGLALMAGALAAVEENNERWCEAELHRLHAELLLAGGQPIAAEAALARAVAVAAAQHARSFELRAATRLARLWHGQRKLPQARQLLAPILQQFNQQPDSLDLQAARALLDTLNRPAAA